EGVEQHGRRQRYRKPEREILQNVEHQKSVGLGAGAGSGPGHRVSAVWRAESPSEAQDAVRRNPNQNPSAPRGSGTRKSVSKSQKVPSASATPKASVATPHFPPTTPPTTPTHPKS